MQLLVDIQNGTMPEGLERICFRWVELDQFLFANLIKHSLTKDDIAAVKRPQHPQGGAPHTPITEAVGCAYDILKKSGNAEIIKPGKLQAFIGYLKECTTEENPNYSEYVSERIKEVKAPNGDCRIIMQNLTDKQKLQFEKTGKNQIVKKTRISSILSVLRQIKEP
jgi:hypothetical protein